MIHLVDKEATKDVRGNEGEGILRSFAEVRSHHCRHDVRVPGGFILWWYCSELLQTCWDIWWASQGRRSMFEDTRWSPWSTCFVRWCCWSLKSINKIFKLFVSQFYLSFMYSTATLMSWIKARSNDPKATVPRWYLNNLDPEIAVWNLAITHIVKAIIATQIIWFLPEGTFYTWGKHILW